MSPAHSRTVQVGTRHLGALLLINLVLTVVAIRTFETLVSDAMNRTNPGIARYQVTFFPQMYWVPFVVVVPLSLLITRLVFGRRTARDQAAVPKGWNILFMIPIGYLITFAPVIFVLYAPLLRTEWEWMARPNVVSTAFALGYLAAWVVVLLVHPLLMRLTRTNEELMLRVAQGTEPVPYGVPAGEVIHRLALGHSNDVRGAALLCQVAAFERRIKLLWWVLSLAAAMGSFGLLGNIFGGLVENAFRLWDFLGAHDERSRQLAALRRVGRRSIS